MLMIIRMAEEWVVLVVEEEDIMEELVGDEEEVEVLAGHLEALETKSSMSWCPPARWVWSLEKEERPLRASTRLVELMWKLTGMLLKMLWRRTSSSRAQQKLLKEPRTWSWRK